MLVCHRKDVFWVGIIFAVFNCGYCKCMRVISEDLSSHWIGVLYINKFINFTNLHILTNLLASSTGRSVISIIPCFFTFYKYKSYNTNFNCLNVILGNTFDPEMESYHMIPRLTNECDLLEV